MVSKCAVESKDLLCIELAQSVGPRQTRLQSFSLPVGCTVLDALRAGEGFDESLLCAGRHLVGIWGRRVDLNQTLREGDRVEIYRPLRVDPKEARRVRYAAKAPKKGKKPNKIVNGS